MWEACAIASQPARSRQVDHFGQDINVLLTSMNIYIFPHVHAPLDCMIAVIAVCYIPQEQHLVTACVCLVKEQAHHVS